MHNPTPNPLLQPTVSELLFAQSFLARTGSTAGLDAAGDAVQRQAFGPRSSYNQLPLQAAIDDSRDVIALASLMRHQPAPQLIFPGGTTLFLRADGTFATPPGGASGVTYVDFTKDLGVARRSGTFDITGLAGLTIDKVVNVVQTAAAIVSKGNARDEPEFDQIRLTGYVAAADTIRCYWSAPGVVVGIYAFSYFVSG